MSSLEVTPNLLQKRGTFLTRSSSFQKFKCSATYQFHLAGSKLSKESLTQLFEKVITHSRILLQVAFVVLALPTFRIFTMVMLWSLDILAKVFGLNLVIENESTAKLQSPKYDGFLVRIIRKSHNNKPTSEPSIQTTEKDTIEDRLKPEVPELLKFNSFKAISNFHISNKVKRNGCLTICVYGCAAFVYMQFVILIVALNVSSTPPGLTFLSLSLFFIGYIVYKIFLKSKYNREPSSPSKPTSPERFRISRSTTRRYLEFHEKTLSEIKLL
jgi:hypothetical protein